LNHKGHKGNLELKFEPPRRREKQNNGKNIRTAKRAKKTNSIIEPRKCGEKQKTGTHNQEQVRDRARFFPTVKLPRS
jgi:hypothetical protein